MTYFTIQALALQPVNIVMWLYLLCRRNHCFCAFSMYSEECHEILVTIIVHIEKNDSFLFVLQPEFSEKETKRKY